MVREMRYKRKPLVAANWKMHGSTASVHHLVGEILSGIGEDDRADLVLCPPFVFLREVVSLLQESRIMVGAQNLSDREAGAYTGEIAGSMLVDVGCSHVIIGHSERRALYGETDELVAKKLSVARATGLTAIVCVGETLAQRESNQTERRVGEQIEALIEHDGVEGLASAVIAYEPVWAIGTGRTATPDQANAVHAFIRELLARHSPDVAESVRLLYGGSVKAGNAAQLFSMPHIDGGLIGGASLDAQEFLAICKATG